MFFGKLADEGDKSNIYNVEGDNLVDNSNIYNVEGNNRLLPGLQLMITRSVLKIPFFSVFVFSIQEIILLSSAKQNIQILDILE